MLRPASPAQRSFGASPGIRSSSPAQRSFGASPGVRRSVGKLKQKAMKSASGMR